MLNRSSFGLVQPLPGVGLDYTKPITSGMFFALNPVNAVNVANGKMAVKRGTASKVVGKMGAAQGTFLKGTSVDAEDWSFGDGGIPTVAGRNYSFCIFLTYHSNNANTFFSTTGAGNDAFHFSADPVFTLVLSNVVLILTGLTAIEGNNYVLGIVYTYGVGIRYWIYNLTATLLSTGNVADVSVPTAVTGQQATLFSKWGTATTSNPSSIAALYMWNRNVPDSYFQQLMFQPYLPFYTPSRRIIAGGLVIPVAMHQYRRQRAAA